MIKVALTGGIATGKSKVAEIISKMGVPVIYADELARDVTRPYTPGWHKIKDTFSSGFFNTDLSINRKKLGEYVFSRPEELVKLEKIIHPYVQAEILKLMRRYAKKGCPSILAEIPLLFETGWDSMFDVSIVVYADEEIQLKRLILRDGLNEEEARRRIKAQIPQDEKVKKAHFVIDNSGDISVTEARTKEVWFKIMEKYGLHDWY